MNATTRTDGALHGRLAPRRRRHVRVDIRGEIDSVCTAPLGHAAAPLVDIGMGGAAFLCAVRLGEVSDRVQLRMRLDEHDEWMRIECELCRLERGQGPAQGRWLHAVSFTRLSPRAWAVLTDYVEIHARSPSVPS